jgi:hypothetical protein
MTQQKTYDPHTAKFLAVVGENMPRELTSDLMQHWIQNPKGLQKVLRNALCPPAHYTVWRTLTLGLHKTPAAYRKALLAAGHTIGSWGDEILGRITCAKQEARVNLVALSVADLGFKDGAYYKDICAKAVEMGLELCPAEVGPAFRLAHTDQSHGEWLRIAMDAIDVRCGDRLGFAMSRDNDGLWLNDFDGRPDGFCYAGDRFVFVCRKQRLGLGALVLIL